MGAQTSKCVICATKPPGRKSNNNKHCKTALSSVHPTEAVCAQKQDKACNFHQLVHKSINPTTVFCAQRLPIAEADEVLTNALKWSLGYRSRKMGAIQGKCCFRERFSPVVKA